MAINSYSSTRKSFLDRAKQVISFIETLESPLELLPVSDVAIYRANHEHSVRMMNLSPDPDLVKSEVKATLSQKNLISTRDQDLLFRVFADPNDPSKKNYKNIVHESEHIIYLSADDTTGAVLTTAEEADFAIDVVVRNDSGSGIGGTFLGFQLGAVTESELEKKLRASVLTKIKNYVKRVSLDTFNDKTYKLVQAGVICADEFSYESVLEYMSKKGVLIYLSREAREIDIIRNPYIPRAIIDTASLGRLNLTSLIKLGRTLEKIGNYRELELFKARVQAVLSNLMDDPGEHNASRISDFFETLESLGIPVDSYSELLIEYVEILKQDAAREARRIETSRLRKNDPQGTKNRLQVRNTGVMTNRYRPQNLDLHVCSTPERANILRQGDDLHSSSQLLPVIGEIIGYGRDRDGVVLLESSTWTISRQSVDRPISRSYAMMEDSRLLATLLKRADLNVGVDLVVPTYIPTSDELIERVNFEIDSYHNALIEYTVRVREHLGIELDPETLRSRLTNFLAQARRIIFCATDPETENPEWTHPSAWTD